MHVIWPRVVPNSASSVSMDSPTDGYRLNLAGRQDTPSETPPTTDDGQQNIRNRIAHAQPHSHHPPTHSSPAGPHGLRAPRLPNQPPQTVSRTPHQRPPRIAARAVRRATGAGEAIAAAGNVAMQVAIWNRIHQAQRAHEPAILRALCEPGNIGRGYLLVVYVCSSNPTGYAEVWEYLGSHVESTAPYQDAPTALLDYARTTRQSGRLIAGCHQINGVTQVLFYFGILSEPEQWRPVSR